MVSALSEINPQAYIVDFFSERGFYRKRCSVCSSYFWTLDPNRQTCGDSPCEEYKFFEREFIKKRMSLKETREYFLNYFQERGHKVLPPRGVAARWRDDLYLVIASIVLFQPFVTSGEVPPPANPLVISQPCIRLNDVDNVGLTAGRHMTIFEMGGHHAFNSSEKRVYWKDETVRYCYDFFSRLGVKPEEITLKESVWIGGGNAGPCFEVAIGGLEVATLVFMEYDVKDNTWTPLPLKIVDTGYGIERISWLSQRSPTAFHAVYGSLVTKFAELLSVELPEEKLLFELAKQSALMKVEGGESVKQLRSIVAKKVGLDVSQLERIMLPVESMFGLLDHTKTLSFMLADGIVPSNSGEGYLARLLIRRSLRLRRRLSQVPLAELVSLQIDYWGEDFRQLTKMRDIVLEEIELEEKRYQENVLKSSQLISTLIQKYPQGNVPVEELVKLYDSNGIDPYLVSDEFQKRGLSVDVPSNFYTLVAQAHSYAKPKEQKKPLLEKSLLEQPETIKLYYDDPNQLEFNARVLASLEGVVILDRTCFYPEGGGQPADTGVIKLEDSTQFRVKDVQSYQGVIVHFLEEKVRLEPGTLIKGIVDSERRLRHTQHHDATHVLLASIRRILGEHIWQAGAQKGFYYSRLDVTHYKKVTKEQVVAIEQLANTIVQEDRKISARFMDRNLAEETYGFTIYQGGVVPGAKIRVVEIQNFDTEACGGTHSESTGRIGYIKILKVEQPQDGILRFIFAAGKSAVEQARKETEILEALSERLNVTKEQIQTKLNSLIEERDSLRREVSELRQAYMNSLLEKVKVVEKGKEKLAYIFLGTNLISASEFAVFVTNKLGGVAIVCSKNKIVVSTPKNKNIDASKILLEVKAKFSGKGGGGKFYAEYLAEQELTESEFTQLVQEVVKLL
ncbi:alanine--tRNA ligase [Candidatus Marsarchaeota G1 archaeon OSP_D]|uniref:Alanine--tRNA ligase n=2 Tax=Candidatus Marsarchaeota group 1 TaxID=2203770 RepID=A0A2R6ADX0_9ARCH|nr:MAG: alanine--tRNA ligase [Candidatus Marsarchaeota G1 archaeon OSP_D]PSN89646.1 MAG: alanine--tRNA ligase [Candidatus Marsarchaeota G1 archaeon OSP_C]